MSYLKYKNVRQTYKGYSYMSKLEANHAFELDMLQKARQILSYRRQVKIDLAVNGKHICNYYIDFVVTYPDGSLEYQEVKGFETDLWRLKWKLFNALYPDLKKIIIK